jgi:hypothetical protein
MEDWQPDLRASGPLHAAGRWLVFVGVCTVICVLVHAAVALFAGITAEIDASLGAIAMVSRIACLAVEVIWLLVTGHSLEALNRFLAAVQGLVSEQIE